MEILADGHDNSLSLQSYQHTGPPAQMAVPEGASRLSSFSLLWNYCRASASTNLAFSGDFLCFDLFGEVRFLIGSAGAVRFRTFEAMASGGEVAKYDSQTMDSLASHSEGELQSTLTKQELSHSQPFTADEVVPNDGENEVSKSKKSHGVHNRKSSSSSDRSGGSHGFLPGLMKKIGLGSQETKATDIHASESHLSGMPRSGSHGFKKKAGSGSHEVKNVGDGEHQHHHRHGTRDKETFGSEDGDREHRDLFGSGDVEYQQSAERANSLFGFEDTKFERGEKGRDLFGSDDPDTLSSREKMNIVGAVDTDADEIERTSNVFGDENTEDSDDEVGSEDNLKRKKKVHNGHSVLD